LKRKSAKIPDPIIALDAAVLIEAQWGCDETWVVFVPREEQVKRIVERDSERRLQC
jgi:dephospho-CoA kinase